MQETAFLLQYIFNIFYGIQCLIGQILFMTLIKNNFLYFSTLQMVCPYQVSQIIIFFLLHYTQLVFFIARNICRHNSEHFDGQGTETGQSS